MTGDNKCYCKNCKGLEDAKVSSTIYYTPPYLIINLDYGKDKKYCPTNVDFGEIIDIKGFTDLQCANKTYSLIGVSTHIGSSGNSGHYIAYCKDLSHEKWYQFNDSRCSPCQIKDVYEYSPYLLVYKRIDN